MSERETPGRMSERETPGRMSAAPEGSQRAAAELAEAVEELAKELERFQQNAQKIVEYQASLLRVNKLMCFWMENTQELIKHRRQMIQPSVSTLKLLRK